VGPETPGGLGAGKGAGQTRTGAQPRRHALKRGHVLLHQLIVTPLQAWFYIRQVGYVHTPFDAPRTCVDTHAETERGRKPALSPPRRGGEGGGGGVLSHSP